MRRATHKSGRVLMRASLSLATLILLVVSVGLNVLQAKRLKAYEQAGRLELEVGTPAPPLEVTTLTGEPRTIDFNSQTTVLYYFSPECGWCEKNWLNVKALIAGTHDRVRFIGLSTTPDVADYMAERRLNFEVYTGLTLEAVRAYRFGGTPQTVVVSPDGVVRHVWAGAYGERQQREIEKAFELALPGLPKPAQPE